LRDMLRAARAAIVEILQLLRRSTVAKSGMWYLVGDLMLKGMGIVTIPIFTRIMTVEDFGIISAYTTLVGLMTVVTGMDIHASIGRAHLDYRERLGDYLSSILALSGVCFVTVFAVVAVMDDRLSAWTDLPHHLVRLSVVHGYSSFVVLFLSYVCLFEERYRARTVMSVCVAVAQVVISVIVISLLDDHKYMGRIVGQLAPLLLVVVAAFYVMIDRRHGARRVFWPRAWRYALVFGVPLAAHDLGGTVLQQFDRLMIQSMVGAEETGLYSYAYNVAMLAGVVLGAVNSAWVPWFYRTLDSGGATSIRALARFLFRGFVVLTAGLTCLGPELARLLAPESFLGAVRVIGVVSLGYLFQYMYTFYINFELYYKRTVAISIGTAIAGAVNIGLNLLLIRRFGYEVACWTAVVSYMVLFGVHYFNVRVVLRDRTIPLRDMIPLSVVMVLIAAQQYVTSGLLEPFSFAERASRFALPLVLMLVLVPSLVVELVQWARRAGQSSRATGVLEGRS